MNQKLRFFMLALLCAVLSTAWADDVTDKLTRNATGVTGTNYLSWSNVNLTSNAVYAGQSAGGNESIQLRATSPSGIISTTSGGKVKKITVTWNSSYTASGRTLDIYGKNDAYNSASELYDNSTQGTKLGSIICGTSTELTVTGDYAYIGLRSKSNAMYLYEINITWEPSENTKTPIATLNSITPTSLVVGDKGSFDLSATYASEGKTISWSCEETSILSLNGTSYEALSAGTANVKVKVTPTDTENYEEVSKSFEVTVKENGFYEGFSKYSSENDGSAEIYTNSTHLDYDGWTNFSKVYAGGTKNAAENGGCGKLGASSGNGSMTANAVGLNGNGLLSFKLKKYGSDNSKMTVSVTGTKKTVSKEFTPNSDWNEYSIDLEGAEGSVSVTFSSTNRIYIDEIRLVKVADDAVKKPSFNVEEGSYFTPQNVEISCETEGSTIYYTLNDTDPTNQSTEYTEPIVVSTTTTIKAIAYVGNDKSNIASVTLTFPEIKENLAALVAETTTTETEFNVTLTDALVTLVAGNNAYMEDATAGIYIYNCAPNDLAVGDKINGVAIVKSKSYNGLPEITSFTLREGYSKTTSNEVVPTELTIEELIGENFSNYISRYVVIKGATVESAFESKSSTITQGESSIVLRDQTSAGNLTTTQGNIVNVTGHPSIYIKNETTTKQFALWSQSQIVVVPASYNLAISDKATDGKSYFATMANIGEGNYVVPTGVSVSTVKVNENGKIIRNIINEGKVIPGDKAYLVESSTAGDKVFELAAANATVENINFDENMLYPATAGVEITAPGDGTYLYYKLTLDVDDNGNPIDNTVGFYWGEDYGGVFTFTGDHKAYLAVPQSNSAGLSSIVIGEFTGISDIQSAKEQNDEIYTLSGVRVKGNLSKGIYIVNGKKHIIK